MTLTHLIDIIWILVVLGLGVMIIIDTVKWRKEFTRLNKQISRVEAIHNRQKSEKVDD